MALWTGLGQAATVAQLVGADVGGLISMIVQAAMTARQNRSECEQIAQLLPHVQEPEAAEPLARLGDTLRDAHELVMSCQGRSAAYQFVMAGRTAEKFRVVQSKIDSYLILFPVISHIGITRRLERIYNVLVQDGSTRDELPHPLSQSSQLQESAEVVQEVLPHGIKEFTLAEIIAATKNFVHDTMIGHGSHGRVYRGRLHDGREVAIKRMSENIQLEDFRTELDVLAQLQHKHIIRLLGWCVSSKGKRLLTRQRKELERLIVYEYMENGTLFDHLHRNQAGSSMLSPVTMSWKMRIDVLLRVSQAIEYMHCHSMAAVPEPTPWQLLALKCVAQIARCCVKFAGKDRPTISSIVANLETACELISRDEPDSADRSRLWPFLEKVDDSPDSPHASSVPLF